MNLHEVDAFFQGKGGVFLILPTQVGNSASKESKRQCNARSASDHDKSGGRIKYMKPTNAAYFF